MLTVQKFGGSSVAGEQGLTRTAGLIAAEHSRGRAVIAVVSAEGDTSDILTDRARGIMPEPPPRELDALLSTGELSSAALLAIKLRSMGISCVSLSGRQAGIRTDSVHGSASITDIDTTRLCSELDSGRTVIVAGFQGVDGADDITTLGRGGSDYTATALAGALNASLCEIFTDVDGIYTADPRLIPEAKLLRTVDIRDMLCLSSHGSQVLQRRCLEEALRSGTDIVLRSSLTASPGTLVTRLSERPAFAGVTRDASEGRVYLVGRGADEAALGLALTVLSDAGLSPRDTVLTEGALGIGLAGKELLPGMRAIHGRFLRADSR